jgi:ribosomal protein S8
MVVNVCEFIALLNHSLLAGQRSFSVRPTKLNRTFALYLRRKGYISGFYSVQSGMRVNPRHSLPGFSRFFAVSTPSRSIYYGRHRLIKELRAGRVYILFSNGRFYDSHYCVQANLGGFVVARVS